MRACPLYYLFLGLAFLATSAPLHADWEIQRIDRDTSLGDTMLAGDLGAYEKDGDIYLYRFSSGSLTRVTQDLYEPTDLMIELEDERLWYWAHAWGDSAYELYEYDARLDQKRRLLTTEAAVHLDYGEYDAGRLVIGLDHDWWLWADSRLERLTVSGQGLIKQDPWLSGDYLVWRAVSGSPGVYVTHLPSRETWSIYENDVPPGSLCVSGQHVAWVDRPVSTVEETHVFHYRLDTESSEPVGTSEESTFRQLDLQPPHLFWLAKTGPSWMLMRTHLEETTEACLYTSAFPMLSIRVSGDDILLVTDNCPYSIEKCWEANVLHQGSGVFTQLTHFGAGSMIFSHWIDSGKIILERHAKSFPYGNEAQVGIKTADSLCGTLSYQPGIDAVINLLILLAPLAILTRPHRRPLGRRPTPFPCV